MTPTVFYRTLNVEGLDIFYSEEVALFEAKDPKKNVATSFDTDCKACHIPAKQDDWVYIRGYPILNPALRK